MRAGTGSPTPCRHQAEGWQHIEGGHGQGWRCECPILGRVLLSPPVLIALGGGSLATAHQAQPSPEPCPGAQGWCLQPMSINTRHHRGPTWASLSSPAGSSRGPGVEPRDGERAQPGAAAQHHCSGPRHDRAPAARTGR